VTFQGSTSQVSVILAMCSDNYFSMIQVRYQRVFLFYQATICRARLREFDLRFSSSSFSSFIVFRWVFKAI
jgi:hypothetical protein